MQFCITLAFEVQITDSICTPECAYLIFDLISELVAKAGSNIHSHNYMCFFQEKWILTSYYSRTQPKQCWNDLIRTRIFEINVIFHVTYDTCNVKMAADVALLSFHHRMIQFHSIQVSSIGINQSFISQPRPAEPLQMNTSSTNSITDVSSFFSTLPSTCLSGATPSTNAPAGRNQVRTWHPSWFWLHLVFFVYSNSPCFFKKKCHKCGFSAQVESSPAWRRCVVFVT